MFRTYFSFFATENGPNSEEREIYTNPPDRFGPSSSVSKTTPLIVPKSSIPKNANCGISKRGLTNGGCPAPIFQRKSGTAPHSNGEEQKLPRKGPFWPNWRLSGQAPVWIFTLIGYPQNPLTFLFSAHQPGLQLIMLMLIVVTIIITMLLIVLLLLLILLLRPIQVR